MDSFGIPYKAVVLRLYECALIKKSKALELLSVEAGEVEKRSLLTGKARRWLKRDRGVENFGSLLANIEFNKEHEFLTESPEVRSPMSPVGLWVGRWVSILGIIERVARMSAICKTENCGNPLQQLVRNSINKTKDNKFKPLPRGSKSVSDRC